MLKKKGILIVLIILITLITIAIVYSFNMKKINYLIESTFKSVESPEITFEILDYNGGNDIQTLTNINCSNDIEYVKYPDGTKVSLNNKNNISFDYIIQRDVNYVFTIKEEGKQETTKAYEIYSVTNIDAEAEKTTIIAGKKTHVSSVVYPDYAYKKDIVWETSDHNIATVTQNGEVMAVSKGTAYIYAKATDGSEVESNRIAINVTADETRLYYSTIFPGYSYLYIDSVYGNDDTGDGSYELPFKTLDRISKNNAIQSNTSYLVVLRSGTYYLTNKVFEISTCNKNINIIGNRDKTSLIIERDIYGNNSSGGGSLTQYTVGLYRLKLICMGGGPNSVAIKTKINFYNVLLDMRFNSASVSYFCPINQGYYFYNCTLPKNVSKLLRNAEAPCQLTNCYGGFTIGYGKTGWNYQTNVITSTPYNDDDNYEILDNDSIWVNKGTGNDRDGTIADIGIYGGQFSWRYSDDVYRENMKIRVYMDSVNVKAGEQYNTQIRTLPPSSIDDLIYSSDDTSIARVSSNGTITGVSKGQTFIRITDDGDTDIRKSVYVSNSSDIIVTPNIDQLIYIDSNYGNDSSGNGTKQSPYKTLKRMTETGIIKKNTTYGVILRSGSYTLTKEIFDITTCDKSIYIIGNRSSTVLNVNGDINGNNSSGGASSIKYTVNIMRLKYHATAGGANAFCTKTRINFYNVLFDLAFNSASVSYFCPINQGYYFYNCTLPKNVSKLLRNMEAPCQLTNCYGGFTLGYGKTGWNYQTNTITSSPQVNSSNYRITDSLETWYQNGTGTNPDGTQANRGLYGGQYSWDYSDNIF